MNTYHSIAKSLLVLLAIASSSTVTGLLAYQAGREAEAPPLHQGDETRRRLIQELLHTQQKLAEADNIARQWKAVEAWTVANPGWLVSMTCQPSGLCARAHPSDNCWRVMVFSPNSQEVPPVIETGNGLLELLTGLLPAVHDPKRNAPYKPVRE